ncbi:MAG TPA: hypothetical protein VMV52_09670 [Candidatus Nanopelagicaceae bacterium]|nr:hypothetical protein [Candidatus Nanopelagicaceae bacterium]
MKGIEDKRLVAIPIGLAMGFGIFLMFLAAVLPIQTIQEKSVTITQNTTSTSEGQSPTSTPLAVHAMPRKSLVKAYGVKVLALVAVPTIVSIVVGLLLWLRQRRKLKWAGNSAWILSGPFWSHVITSRHYARE